MAWPRCISRTTSTFDVQRRAVLDLALAYLGRPGWFKIDPNFDPLRGNRASNG